MNATLHIYDKETRVVTWKQASSVVPRVGDKIRLPSGRLVAVLDTVWFWPQPPSTEWRLRPDQPVVDVTVLDVWEEP